MPLPYEPKITLLFQNYYISIIERRRGHSFDQCLLTPSTRWKQKLSASEPWREREKENRRAKEEQKQEEE
jgi:hypothetical protein